MKKSAPKPTKAQQNAFRRSVSYGVLFERSHPIYEVPAPSRGWTSARNPGRLIVQSVRRFGSVQEAKMHGRRFTRIEGHVAFWVVTLESKPNAWVNLKTGKTNPLIGLKRKRR